MMGFLLYFELYFHIIYFSYKYRGMFLIYESEEYHFLNMLK